MRPIKSGQIGHARFAHSRLAQLRCWLLVMVVGICVFATAVPPAAGQQTAAGIVGHSTDETGGVLPGVAVTATSPALQVPEVSAVTDEHGEYRLTPLPLEQSITVTGASPIVDMTSTGTATLLTRETLDLTPTVRNGIISMLAQAPSVRAQLDVGGSQLGTPPRYRVNGMMDESWVTLEGVVTTREASWVVASYERSSGSMVPCGTKTKIDKSREPSDRMARLATVTKAKSCSTEK
jgi:hypothetical protein